MKKEENGEGANGILALEAMDYNLSAGKHKEEATTYLHVKSSTMLTARKYQRQLPSTCDSFLAGLLLLRSLVCRKNDSENGKDRLKLHHLKFRCEASMASMRKSSGEV